MTAQITSGAQMTTPEKCSRWNKFSEMKLVELEKQILKVLKTAYRGWFVNIGNVVGTDDKIWTIALNESSKNTPLVCLHGFAAAVGFWCLNLDAFAENRPVYAIDLPGFGRSSRPKFSTDGLEAEQEMVKSIEQWRIKMNLEKFVLMGHSFGAYLATAYTMNHPDRVQHLILADPWGFAEKTVNHEPPLWAKTLKVVLYPFTHLNPLATLRAAGPFGPWVISKTRADISSKYEEALGDKDIICNYIYQCNSQNPTGEAAFHSMMKGFGWAKNPMIQRVHKLNKEVPMTIIYGNHTWMDKSIGNKLIEMRPDSYVSVTIIDNAGHHVHADRPKQFNTAVVNACNQFDPVKNESTNTTTDNAQSKITVNVDLEEPILSPAFDIK